MKKPNSGRATCQVENLIIFKLNLNGVALDFHNPQDWNSTADGILKFKIKLASLFGKYDSEDFVRKANIAQWFKLSNSHPGIFIQFVITVADFVVKKTFAIADHENYFYWTMNVLIRKYWWNTWAESKYRKLGHMVVDCDVFENENILISDYEPKLPIDRSGDWYTELRKFLMLQSPSHLKKLFKQSQFNSILGSLSETAKIELFYSCGYFEVPNYTGPRKIIQATPTDRCTIDSGIVLQSQNFQKSKYYTAEMENALNWYIGTGYVDLNNPLYFSPEKTELQKALTHPRGPKIAADGFFVWRAMYTNHYNCFTGLSLIPGDVTSSGNSFMSTSHFVITQYLGRTCCLLKIFLPNGFPCIWDGREHDEILLPLHTQFRYRTHEIGHYNEFHEDIIAGTYDLIVHVFIYDALPYTYPPVPLVDKIITEYAAYKKCHWCTASNPTQACAKCGSSFYCNVDCQSNHWGAHKRECK